MPENTLYPTLVGGASFGPVWETLLGEITIGGNFVDPRGQRTLELTPVTLYVADASSNVLVNRIRNLNYRFMVAEWLWVWFGLNKVSYISKYNSKIAQYSDDGEIMTGAYGPRLSVQWSWLLQQLRANPNTRQGVVTIWSHNPTPSKDIPCTISLQFLERLGRLHLIVNMRSSDIWLGLPYDFFTFSQLLNIISSKLRLPIGSLTMNLGSSHLYEKHMQLAGDLIDGPVSETLQSPVLPDVNLTHLPECFIGGECTGYDPHIWGYYHRVLHAETSLKALEVLREASSFAAGVLPKHVKSGSGSIDMR